MKNVYILTEEGREYSDEGCTFVENMLRKENNETDRLIFSMGAAYNAPKHLIEQLDKNPESYVIISTEKRIIVISGDNIDVLKQNLSDFPNQTSWQTASESWEECFASQQEQS